MNGINRKEDLTEHMTEGTQKYITPGSHNQIIPSRDEFHKYATAKLYLDDFTTDYPTKIPGLTVAKIESSLYWTEKLKDKNKWNFLRVRQDKLWET